MGSLSATCPGIPILHLLVSLKIFLENELQNINHSGGFLPILGMIQKIIGTLGLDFPLDEECNEKEGGILPALGALLPMALKVLPLVLDGAGTAASITHSVNQKRHND